MLREELSFEFGALPGVACHGEAGWKVNGKSYCLMHAPTKDKADKFEKAFQDKLAAKDYNFSGVWFPDNVNFLKYDFTNEVYFILAVFSGAANFYAAQFNGGRALFGKAHFSGETASFHSAQFSGGEANFYQAQFSGESTSFTEAQFSGGHANFSEARFDRGAAWFNDVQFSGGNAYFGEAQFGGYANFNGAQFSGDADFRQTKFSGWSADFRNTRFNGGADFVAAYFSGRDVWFSKAQFSKTVSFVAAVFAKNLKFENAVFEKQVFFDEAEFKPEAFADFGLARFMDFTRFMDLKIEEGAEFYFGEATFERPERVHFHSIPDLRPRWFINVDTRKFNFESVDFPLLKKRAFIEILKIKTAAKKELKETEAFLKRLDKRKPDEELPHKLLITAYRRLAENAEENNRYEEAMGLRYLAMETHRRSDAWRRFLPVTLHWWYWASSGYGERALRAGIMLFLIWLIPFLFYASPWSIFHRPVNDKDIVLNYVTAEADGKVPDIADMPALSAIREDNLRDAAFYSLNVMAFQKPEPKPANESWLTRLVVILQTILGPVQATLLLLAIRRKFMR